MSAPYKVNTSVLYNDIDNIENNNSNNRFIHIDSINDYFAQTEKCMNYNYKIADFIVPPSGILSKLCSNDDKTYMFAVSLFRFIIYASLTFIYYTHIFTAGVIFHYLLFIILLIICIINFIIFCFIPFKTSKKLKN